MFPYNTFSVVICICYISKYLNFRNNILKIYFVLDDFVFIVEIMYLLDQYVILYQMFVVVKTHFKSL